MAVNIYPPAPNPIAEQGSQLVTRPWLAFFQRLGTAAMQLLTGDVSSTGAGVTTITNNAVTFAKIQTVNADKLLGRGHGLGTGTVQEITLGTGLSMTGTTLNVSGGSVPYMPLTLGDEPPTFVTDGAGRLIMVVFTP